MAQSEVEAIPYSIMTSMRHMYSGNACRYCSDALAFGRRRDKSSDDSTYHAQLPR
jgi:hypothetical protein